MPFDASEMRSSWIAAFAPTSTPRVGSSAISTLGEPISHFANSVFCWFPPDRERTGAARLRARMSTWPATCATEARSRRTFTNGPFDSRRRCGSETFSRIGRRISSP